ncbi:MAG: DegT/DnrJ/EryC1/StrS family aminotransferase [Nanoarchaeota archaeon]|nr:DegT/DnrJ/EryC1/StrS family aminotransferase [Nanoarchaeota archaeon]
MEEEQRRAVEKIESMTRHDAVRLTDRCNASIFLAMAIAQKLGKKASILIPDQGGWTSFRNYPKLFSLDVIEVKTDYGVIDLKDLKAKTKYCGALIFTSFAGYFAEQPVKKISSICRDNNCMMIEDASGALGYSKLCNGKYSDIIVGSFSDGSSVNVGYGGFISSSKPEYFDIVKDAFSIIKVHPALYPQLEKKLNSSRLKMLIDLAEKVKKNLKGYEILHRDSESLNVVAKFSPEIIKYCMVHNYPYILCPNYIRVNERAVSIELKSLSDKELMKRS